MRQEVLKKLLNYLKNNANHLYKEEYIDPIWVKTTSQHQNIWYVINAFDFTGLSLYPLKTSEN